ncbi:MAG TPA: hypothetical protein VM899_11475 [Rubellimicrobium sp.]|jgi:hypothetical protein|nr:hypothetical protein [Rubellimicrobium sp.]
MQPLTLLAEPRRIGLLVVVVLILIVGASLGIIYAAYHGSLLGVILAALVPGYLVGRVLEPVQRPSIAGQNEGL